MTSYFDYPERGDVTQNIRDTLEGYFGTRIDILPRNVCGRLREGDFVCYPFMNVIVPTKRSEAVDDFLRRDTGGGLCDWKSVARHAIRIALLHGGTLTGKTVFRFDDTPKHPESLLIFANNKKVKLLRFEAGVIVNLVKEGYTDAWYRRELGARVVPRFDFVLPLRETAPRVYEERLLYGQAYTRAGRSARRRMDPLIEDVLVTLPATDHEDVSSAEYAHSLEAQFAALGEETGGRFLPGNWPRVVSLFERLAEYARRHPVDIKLCMSHGDFQRGNLFLEEPPGRLWLLDWETWGRRSACYDRLVYFYNFRNLGAMSRNLANVARSGGASLYPGGARQRGWRTAAAVCLMEDVIVKLDESATLPGKALAVGTETYSTLPAGALNAILGQ